MAEARQPAEPPDAELIVRWGAGDERAAAILIARHTPALARFLAAAGASAGPGGGDDLDDLVQETFWRAFRRLDRFRAESSFRTWLLAIGSNALKDARRRRRRSVVIPLAGVDPPDRTSDPHAEAVEGELLDRLAAAVRGLPRLQRDVFLLRAQQGESYEAIAAALGTTVGAARVHYHHAVTRLKAIIGDASDE